MTKHFASQPQLRILSHPPVNRTAMNKDVKRVGIWLRVSTDMQVKDDSPEHHEKRARNYAAVKDWHVVEVYRLDAVSGKTVMEQAEARRMIRDIKDGTISGLIFSKLARLARNTKELLEFADIFRESGADLISLAEAIDTSTPAGRLFFTIIAAMAQWEREEISSRVQASVPIRAQLGKQTGGAASYGFQWKGKEFVIDENEAPIRKLLYELFLKHQRKKRVSAELNAKGYRTRNGSPFSDTTVGRLLRDPSAKGERRANYTTSQGKGKKWDTKPSDEWVIVPCPAIVSSELWDECNRILDEQEGSRRKPSRTVVHLLAGYVSCTCGKRMYVYHTSKVYECRPCKNRIPVTDIDDIYQEYLKGYLTDINPADYVGSATESLAEREELLRLTLDERAKLGKRMEQLVNMRLDHELDKASFQERYKPLETRAAQLDEQLPNIEADIDFKRIQQLTAETVIEEAKALYDHWADMAFEAKRAIVETITETITIGTADIHIELAYNPALSGNPGKGQRNFRDSSMRSG
jgi:site-specific DNA recombinase